MKNSRKILFVSILMCFCMILFTGCTFSIPFTNKVNHYTPEIPRIEQYSVIDEEDLEGLSYSERKQLIAERYIEISFTVLIYEVKEITVNNQKTLQETQYSFGSGFIVHTGGYILTNHHVIEKMIMGEIDGTNGQANTTTYKCYVSQDGAETIYEAQLLWYNETFDMAILICEDFADLGAASLKDRTIFCDEEEKIKVLEDVITIGTQANLEYYATATSGSITSNLLRVAISDNNIYEHLIQHNASINHGNSGGALVDMNGQVIGLNTLGDDTANSLFFAVSIYPAIAVLDKVVENYELHGETTEDITFGFKGTDKDHVKYSSQTEITFAGRGVYVVELLPGCIIPDLQVEDVIIGLTVTTPDGNLTFNIKDQNTLLYARIWLLYSTSGTVKILRNGIETNLLINLS